MRRTPVRVGIVVGLVLTILLTASPQAVGTLVVTSTRLSDLRVVKHSLAWVSDESGDVSANIAALAVVQAGYIQQINFVPDGGGTAPTALYDVSLVDANGVDYFAAAGANLSATVSTLVRQAAPLLYDGTGTLDLIVANAGISKGGTVHLWMTQE